MIHGVYKYDRINANILFIIFPVKSIFIQILSNGKCIFLYFIMFL